MSRDHEADRYRKAAHLALGELEWCERYLRSIRKPRLAQQVAMNVASIRRRLEEPVGGEATESDLSARG
jgi:hypothetical protein